MKHLAIGAALLLAATGARLRAADELPKAETILEKNIEATGGRAAYEKNHSETMSGTIEFVANGIKGTVNSYRAEPDKSLMEMEIGGIGKIQEGTNGTVAWSLSAIQGPRVKEGEEKATSLREAKFNSELKWKELYKTVETVGVEAVDGKDCYKVVMTPNEGSPVTRYYDKQSYLLAKTTATLKSPMGEIPVESIMADYRKEGAFLVPHKLTQKAAGQEISLTVDKVVFNPDIPKDKFDLPAEIKALVEKK